MARDEPPGRIFNLTEELRRKASDERAKFRAPPPNDDDDVPALKTVGLGTLLQCIPRIAPREWLLGTTFCKKFVSGLIAHGAVGKTSVRYAQYLALATGRPLTGEHVHKRCRVLILCFEDDQAEVQRRFAAAVLHYKLTPAEIEELDHWVQIATPPPELKLMITVGGGFQVIGDLYKALSKTLDNFKADLVSIDPFVKAHGVEENNNNAIAAVLALLAQLATDKNCAFDICHHARKGNGDAGDADRSRGASANVDAMRLARTLTLMSAEEARLFGIAEAERKAYVRLDDAKVNITKNGEPMWFRLISIPLGNATLDYPKGDHVQAVERWHAPDIWDGPLASFGALFDDLNAGFEGRRYTDANRSGQDDRAAWKVVQRHLDRTEAQARQIVATWVRDDVFRVEQYHDPVARRPRSGLFGNLAKRPG